MAKVMIVKKKAKGGLKIEDNAYSQISPSTIMLGGKTHKQGGTDLSYMGKTVEAEKGEPVSIDQGGNAVIYGNMKVPGTNKKFKSVAKALAEKETKTTKRILEGTDMVNSANPEDKWDRLKFNSGVANMKGGLAKLNEINQNREWLGRLQEAMLELSDEGGMDPQMMSEGSYEAKKGLKIKPKAQMGWMSAVGREYQRRQALNTPDITPITSNASQSMAVRHNNPGNMKYAPWMKKYGALKGEYAAIDNDGTYFAKFPDTQKGLSALREQLKRPLYAGKTAEQAISTWTNSQPYGIDLGNLKGKRIADMSEGEFNNLVNIITQGEDSKVYNTSPNQPPVTTTSQPSVSEQIEGMKKRQPFITTPLPTISQQEQFRKITPGQEYTPQFKPLSQYSAPSNTEPLQASQLLGETYALATNKQEPVHTQRYEPDLFSPYQVSFQDRLNQNASTFRALQKANPYDPSALGTLGAQKYQADTQALAEEFRTNQSISNEITNKNISLLNDAELKNLQLADTQFVRQSEGKSKTKATNQAVLNSISNKILQQEAANRRLQVYENLYPYYRFDPNTGQKIYYGPPADEVLQPIGNQQTDPLNPNQSMRQNYDRMGKLRSTTINTPSDLSTQQQQQNLYRKQPIVQFLNSSKNKNKYNPLPFLQGFGYQYQ